MNFCNFAKVIIGWSSKDFEFIKWWLIRENDINFILNVKFLNKLLLFRYNFYNNVMYRYLKMYLLYDKFVC